MDRALRPPLRDSTDSAPAASRRPSWRGAARLGSSKRARVTSSVSRSTPASGDSVGEGMERTRGPSESLRSLNLPSTVDDGRVRCARWPRSRGGGLSGDLELRWLGWHRRAEPQCGRQPAPNVAARSRSTVSRSAAVLAAARARAATRCASAASPLISSTWPSVT